MNSPVPVLSSFLLFALLAAPPGAAPQDSPAARAAECHEWRQCRQLALDALARGEYEHFHDLAWRTVQTGPPRDPALMYLLARAQSLSGRPHDALVMLDRLADMGVATDAATNDDFKLVRTLREWPDLDAKIRELAAPSARETAAAGPAPPASEPPARARSEAAAAPPAVNAAIARHPVEDAVRVGGVRFSPRGLAYDAVSSRFVVADLSARKLVILDERSRRAIDLVRASSAGFTDIAAFEIDPRRGDLWVVSSGGHPGDGSDAAAVLHKLQLVSGRPLGSFTVPTKFSPVRFTDVAVTPSGTVLMLDAQGGRILAFDPASRSFSEAAKLDVEGATSLAPADDRTVYVAHRDGIVHVDLAAHASVSVRPAPETVLSGFGRIRWSKGSLVGVQRRDGDYAVVEVTLRNHHASITAVTDAPVADPTTVTLAGDDLYVARSGGNETVVERIRIR